MLQDINSPFYRDEATGKNLLPWELRVLAVRLQGVGYGDSRRGIGGYYDLARVARAEVKKANDDAEKKSIWKERLKQLGLCVANALIEMGDAGAAIRHLESLRPRDGKDEVLEGRLALLYINAGNVEAARQSLSDASASVRPMLSMADGRYADAAEQWKALPSSDLVTQNLAICLFYTGKVHETLELLDQLVEKGRTFHALTFNLATVYELCTEKGSQRKEDLVGRVCKSIEERGGGERVLIDFKL